MNPFAAASDLQWSSGSAFRGAEVTRFALDRLGTASHPDSEVMYSARALRARARDLVRNDPYAAGAVESFADNIVGEHGIRLKPKITLPFNDLNGTAAPTLNWEIERAWQDWANEHATVDGLESWYETERLIAKSWATDGEVFVRRRRGWDNPYGFAVELIDPDLLDETFNAPAARNGGREIVMGVELNPHGRRLAFHFWTEHPDAGGRRARVRIPADEITHFFVRYRTGQNRGYSLFAPILTTVEMINGLAEAELVASRLHASKMGFITNDTPEAIQAYAARLAMQGKNGAQDQPVRTKSAPGTWTELHPGQGVESFDPTHPNDAFEAFLKVMLRGVARGLGVSYHTLTGDTAEANYSSQRISLVPERDRWRAVQRIFARRIHQPVYRDWLGTSLLAGALTLPSPLPTDFYAVEWRGRRWQWIDPANDLQAAEAEIKLGINSRQRLAADRGLDYETVVDECAEDQAYAREAGVFVGGANALLPAKPNGNGAANGNGGGKPAAVQAVPAHRFLEE